MTTVPVLDFRFPAMTESAVEMVRGIERRLLATPQFDLGAHQVLHREAGIYARTILLPADREMTGALIKLATLVILNGDCEVLAGNHWVRYTGHCVLPASAGRKMAFRALADTHITMTFPTSARTTVEAEEQFTDEAHRLASRREGARNETIITGE